MNYFLHRGLHEPIINSFNYGYEGSRTGRNRYRANAEALLTDMKRWRAEPVTKAGDANGKKRQKTPLLPVPVRIKKFSYLYLVI